MSPDVEVTHLSVIDLNAEMSGHARKKILRGYLDATDLGDEADKAGVPCRYCFGSAGIVMIGQDGKKNSGHDLCPVTAKCFHHLHAIVYDERGR